MFIVSGWDGRRGMRVQVIPGLSCGRFIAGGRGGRTVWREAESMAGVSACVNALNHQKKNGAVDY